MDDLERDLERELHRVLDPLRASAIPARRLVNAAGYGRRVAGTAGAALAFKIATGVAVAAAATSLAGAATTAGMNPTSWGQRVTNSVETLTGERPSPPAKAVHEDQPGGSTHKQESSSSGGQAPDKSKSKGHKAPKGK